MATPPDTVDVYRGPDELQAELIRGALESAGIAVRVYGLRRGASIGMGEQVVDVRVMVPATQRVAAERALSDLADAAAGSSEPDGPAPALRPRRRLFAAVATVIAPGLGQVYVQHQISGALLLAAVLLVWAGSVSSAIQGSVPHGRAIVASLVVGWAMDLALAQRAITARHAGRPSSSPAAQLAQGALQVALVLGVAWVVGTNT